MDARVGLITGAAHGIGAGIASRLYADGWHVVLVDHDAAGVRAQADRLGPRAHPVVADVADEAAVEGAITQAQAIAGRLDALICNAGIMVRKPLAALSLAEWSRVLATNLTSTFLFVRAAEALLRRAGGAVVTIASTRAHMSEPNTESYAAAKGGLVALTHALAVSLGPDVRVNCISPGWIDVHSEALRPVDHAQHPAGRVGTPADVAALVAWLLEPSNSFATGAEFTLDGGMTRKMIYAE